MKKAPSSTDNEAKTPALSVVKLEDEITQITDKYEQLLQSYDSLQHQVKQFQRHRFGQRSEVYVDPENPQGLLFSDHKDDSSSNNDENNKKKKVVKIKKHEREVKSTKQFADHLPRKKQWINVPDHLRTCACGCQKSR